MLALPVAMLRAFHWFAIPLDAILAYFLMGMEELAAQLENPFGVDPNDLPLEQFTSTARNHIFEMISMYDKARRKGGREGGERGGGKEGREGKEGGEDVVMDMPCDGEGVRCRSL